LNISQLRAFVMVVEQGTFSGAARAMHLSQPAVTMQVQALEADIGATLLDRGYRKVELTEAGRMLLPFAKRVLEEIEEARDEIANMTGRVTGRLELAASTTPGQYILPGLLGKFLKQNPEVGVSIKIHDTAEVVEAVEEGRAHMGVTGAQIKGARATFEQLGSDDIVMICHPDHHLATAKNLTVGEVAREPFIMREVGSGTRIVVEEVLRSAGVDPGDLEVVTELGTNEAIVNAVEGGMGVGAVSTWVVDKALELGTVVPVPLPHFPVNRPLYVVTPRGTMTRAADAFLEHLREHLG
jgi:DNA-binding transcriptional LysR family regulator